MIGEGGGQNLTSSDTSKDRYFYLPRKFEINTEMEIINNENGYVLSLSDYTNTSLSYNNLFNAGIVKIGDRLYLGWQNDGGADINSISPSYLIMDYSDNGLSLGERISMNIVVDLRTINITINDSINFSYTHPIDYIHSSYSGPSSDYIFGSTSISNWDHYYTGIGWVNYFSNANVNFYDFSVTYND